MAKKKNNERAGDRWEDHVALLPLRFSDATVIPGRPVLMGGADEAEQSRLYGGLLKLDWLAPEIRRAVLKVLGRSQRVENVSYERAWTLAASHMVEEAVAQKRSSGERPRGGIRQAAVAEVASRLGMDPDTLKQRFKRVRRR